MSKILNKSNNLNILIKIYVAYQMNSRVENFRCERLEFIYIFWVSCKNKLFNDVLFVKMIDS